jgi:hypothetical protein
VSILRPLDVALNASGLNPGDGSFGANDQLLLFNNAQAVRMGVLWGDVNGNGAVTNTDVSLVKGQVGASAEPSNFPTDLNANGSLMTAVSDRGYNSAQHKYKKLAGSLAFNEKRQGYLFPFYDPRIGTQAVNLCAQRASRKRRSACLVCPAAAGESPRN